MPTSADLQLLLSYGRRAVRAGIFEKERQPLMRGEEVVNPRDKEFDPEDPMELVGVEIPGGDADQALDDLVQEYLFMGWSPGEILFLFRSPHYAATHRIYRQKGQEYVKARIQQLADQWNRGWIKGDESNA